MIELQLDCYSDDQTQKVRVVDRLVFTPNSFWKIDSFRRCTGEKIDAQAKVSFEAEDCIDRKGKVGLKTTMYNGKARNEVDFYAEPEAEPGSGSGNGPRPGSPQQQQPPAPKGTVPKSGQPF
jgi:hypothetical protein